MRNRILATGAAVVLFNGAMLLTISGCGQTDTAEVPTTQPDVVASPGSAPTFGSQSGMGFSTGDAAHSGQGSGLMGYHGEGAMGTSGTISDKHEVIDPVAPTTAPVLPAP